MAAVAYHLLATTLNSVTAVPALGAMTAKVSHQSRHCSLIGIFFCSLERANLFEVRFYFATLPLQKKGIKTKAIGGTIVLNDVPIVSCDWRSVM